jgi:hypothetical protein
MMSTRSILDYERLVLPHPIFGEAMVMDIVFEP